MCFALNEAEKLPITPVLLELGAGCLGVGVDEGNKAWPQTIDQNGMGGAGGGDKEEVSNTERESLL